jgi:hypothetical protein
LPPPNTSGLTQSNSQIDNNQLISNYNNYDKNQLSPPKNLNSTNQLSSNNNNLALNFIDSNLDNVDHQFIDSSTSTSFNVVNSTLTNNKYITHTHNQFNPSNNNSQNICSYSNTER